MKLSFYCAMQRTAKNKPELSRKKPTGIDGEKVFLIHSEDLYAAVSYTKHRSFRDTPENRERHRKIIEHFQSMPVVPFAFGTIVGETIGRGVLCKHYKRLIETLAVTGGRMQFAVKVYRMPPDTAGQPLLKTPGSIKQRQPADKMTDKQGHRLAGRIHNTIREFAVASRYERMKSDTLIMDGAYLVEVKNAPNVTQSIEWARSLYPELIIDAAGPEPPVLFNPVKIAGENTRLFGEISR